MVFLNLIRHLRYNTTYEKPMPSPSSIVMQDDVNARTIAEAAEKLVSSVLEVAAERVNPTPEPEPAPAPDPLQPAYAPPTPEEQAKWKAQQRRTNILLLAEKLFVSNWSEMSEIDAIEQAMTFYTQLDSSLPEIEID